MRARVCVQPTLELVWWARTVGHLKSRQVITGLNGLNKRDNGRSRCPSIRGEGGEQSGGAIRGEHGEKQAAMGEEAQ